MIPSKRTLVGVLATAGAVFAAACSDSGNPAGLPPSNSGTLIVQLTDAPFLGDSLKSVDIFVVRVDARVSDPDSASANSALSDDSSSTSGWKTVASPNASFNLLDLQNGVAATLGQANLAPGSYNGFRLVIDPSKSSVTLKGGQVLSGGTKPGIDFPSASRSGIKIVLAQPVLIVPGTTTVLSADFNVNNSFVMRGNSIDKNGLLFKPVIKATVTNLALTNANVRLANATNDTLNFLENGTVLTGSSNIAFGTSSACASVNATTPALTVTQPPSTTPLAGFAPTLVAGKSFSIVAFPGASGVQFATLSNTFTATAGQAGFRVFNATAGATGLDVFVTAPAAPLGTATVANVLAATGSAFVSVAADTSQIRITGTGSTTVLLDMGKQALKAGQNTTLVIAPPASGTTPRAFLVAGC